MQPRFEYEPDAKSTEIETVCKAFGIRRHPDTLFTAIGPYGLISLSMEAKKSGVVQVSP